MAGFICIRPLYGHNYRVANPIRDNIRVMLDSVRAELRTLREREQVLKERETKLIEWMREEEPPQTSFVAVTGVNGMGSTLVTTLLATLVDGGKTTDQLAELATMEGLIDPQKSAKRAVNAVMQGLYSRHLVKKAQDGRWLKK